MSPIEQAPVETCGAIAAPETERPVCLPYGNASSVLLARCTTAKLLDMPSVEPAAFHRWHGRWRVWWQGRQPDHEPLAVLGAKLTGRPVKFMLGPGRRDAGGRASRCRAFGTDQVTVSSKPMGVSRPVSLRAFSIAVPTRGSHPTRSSEGNRPFARARTRSRTSPRTSIAFSQIARRQPPCAALALPASILRSNAIWTAVAESGGHRSDRASA